MKNCNIEKVSKTINNKAGALTQAVKTNKKASIITVSVVTSAAVLTTAVAAISKVLKMRENTEVEKLAAERKNRPKTIAQARHKKHKKLTTQQ